jgi:uncharacterized protein YwqG
MKTFDIIRFTPSNEEYYPSIIDKDKFSKYSRNEAKRNIYYHELEIPLGKSRIGGCVIDVPKGFEFPENMFFAAQLDLSEFSKFDKINVLPKKGFLYFFCDKYGVTGKVIFVDVENSELERIIKEEHEQFFYSGILIDKIYPETESYEERYIEKEPFKPHNPMNIFDEIKKRDTQSIQNLSRLKDTMEGEAKKSLDALLEKLQESYKEKDLKMESLKNEMAQKIDDLKKKNPFLEQLYNPDSQNKKEDIKEMRWDDLAGCEKSKIFGIYSHCQYHEHEIKEITESDNYLLLQVGEDFTEVGVWSVLIPKNDLKNLHFENCKFAWGQD